MILEFEGFIENITYSPKFAVDKSINEYNLSDFDSNECASFGKIKVDDNDYIFFTKWVTPKRTRSYPFARLYNVYNTNSKIITIIPIIKDEGGDSGNNDRINAITFSWMNLLNVYIIVAYYETAEKKQAGTRKTAANLKIKGKKVKTEYITKQMFNNEYIKSKIKEVSKYKMTALHWNTKHFKEDFEKVWLKSVECYKKISKDEKVELHSFDNHLKRLDEFKVDGIFNLEKFKEVMNKRSKEAQNREALTIHDLEVLNQGHNAKFYIENYLGGIYYLTCDEIFIENNKFIIQESKNSSKGKFPAENDIKDGLFKLILFSNMENLEYRKEEVDFTTRLKLTGNIDGDLVLPAEENIINDFLMRNNFTKKVQKIINDLNSDSSENGISIHIGSNISVNQNNNTTTMNNNLDKFLE